MLIGDPFMSSLFTYIITTRRENQAEKLSTKCNQSRGIANL